MLSDGPSRSSRRGSADGGSERSDARHRARARGTGTAGAAGVGARVAARSWWSQGSRLHLAGTLARDGRYDLHRLIELVERGCPPGLAVRSSLRSTRAARTAERAGCAYRSPWSPPPSREDARRSPRGRSIRSLAGGSRSSEAYAAGRGRRPAPRAPAAGSAVRDRPPEGVTPTPPRRHRRDRPGGGGRRVAERAGQARRLPRPLSLHHVGLQARPTRPRSR